MNDRIKKLRQALNLTQQEFAQRIGSVQNTITGYEKGRRSPSNQTIALICKEFNVNEEWLRNGTGAMFNPALSKDKLQAAIDKILAGETTSFRSRLIMILADLSLEQWEVMEQKVLELAEGSQPVRNTEMPAQTPPEQSDVNAEIIALKQQNAELLRRIEAIEKEDALTDAFRSIGSYFGTENKNRHGT